MGDAPADHVEVEWQFSAVDTRPVARWLEGAAVPGFSVRATGTKEMEDRYVETVDWRLNRAGFTGRIRRKGDGAELTLKGMAGAVGGMRSRREVNERLASEELSGIPATGPASEIIRAVAGKSALRELFTIRTRRQTYELSDGAGVVGEIALDETSIPVGEDVPVRMARVEVEVDGGAVDRAKRFVDVLVAGAGLTAAGTSKFEAALIATGQRPPEGRSDLGPTAVTEGLTAGEVAFAVMRKHFGVLLANEPGTRMGEDIEALHDMRVAARRLRAAMSAFRPYLPVRLEAYREELGWLGRVLGEVRDLDVQLEGVEEWRSGFGPEQAKALDAIEALLVRRRVGARRRMLTALDSRRYERFVERFSAVLRQGPAVRFAPGREPILLAAPEMVGKRYRGVRRRGDRIKAGSAPSAYHLLRIDAKKLRYALEFVGPVYGKQAVEFSQRVTALQDVLGLHQDAEVAVTMLEEMAQEQGRRLPVETILAMGALAERFRVKGAALRREFPGVYRPLTGKNWRGLERLMVGRKVLAEPVAAARPVVRTAVRTAARRTVPPAS